MTGARERLDAIGARVTAFPDDADLAAMHAALTVIQGHADSAAVAEIDTDYDRGYAAAMQNVAALIEAALQPKEDRS
jgi:hypothetical protein